MQRRAIFNVQSNSGKKSVTAKRLATSVWSRFPGSRGCYQIQYLPCSRRNINICELWLNLVMRPCRRKMGESGEPGAEESILPQSYNGRNSWHWTYLQINSNSSHKSVFKISHSLEVWGRNPILRFNLDLNFWIFVLSLQTSITWLTLLAECQRDSS